MITDVRPRGPWRGRCSLSYSRLRFSAAITLAALATAALVPTALVADTISIAPFRTRPRIRGSERRHAACRYRVGTRAEASADADTGALASARRHRYHRPSRHLRHLGLALDGDVAAAAITATIAATMTAAAAGRAPRRHRPTPPMCDCHQPCISGRNAPVAVVMVATPALTAAAAAVHRAISSPRVPPTMRRRTIAFARSS